MRCERGQSSVEVVAMAPIVLLCGLIGLQALVAGANYVVAGNAAHAGALAGQLGRNADRAARASTPGWSTGSIEVTDRGRVVNVRLKPRAVIPPLAGLLAVRASARYTGQ